MALGMQPITPADRRRRNRDKMTAAILEVSRQVMRQDGVAALNLQEVARRLGIRAPSLYEYFDGKMALYDALFALGVRTWSGYLDRVLRRSHESPWRLLEAIFEAYIDFGDEYPELYKLIHERHVPGFEPSSESLSESVRLTQRGVEALQAWVDAGQLTPGLATEKAFDLAIVVMHGLTGAHVADRPGERDPGSRFRSLVPPAVALFQAAWSPTTTKAPPQRRRRKP